MEFSHKTNEMRDRTELSPFSVVSNVHMSETVTREIRHTEDGRGGGGGIEDVSTRAVTLYFF